MVMQNASNYESLNSVVQVVFKKNYNAAIKFVHHEWYMSPDARSLQLQCMCGQCVYDHWTAWTDICLKG